MPIVNPSSGSFSSRALFTGEDTFDRFMATQSATLTSGTLRATYFRAERSETITQLLLTTAGTAAAATPTLVRAGIYAVAGDWTLSLIASIANDTTIYAAANTEYTRALDVPFEKVAGTWYAFGVLCVTGVQAPTIPSLVMAASILSGSTSYKARTVVSLSAQTDLPASVTTGSNSTSSPYGVMLP